jgi:hypothetical protein
LASFFPDIWRDQHIAHPPVAPNIVENRAPLIVESHRLWDLFGTTFCALFGGDRLLVFAAQLKRKKPDAFSHAKLF